MSRIKDKDTVPELTVRKFLFKSGYRYRIHDKRYVGKPDIVLPMYRTVIFIHGCFWHSHTNCSEFKMPKSNIEYWQKKLNSNITRDARHQQHYKNSGWNVVIIWECELTSKNKEKTLANLLKQLH